MERIILGLVFRVVMQPGSPGNVECNGGEESFFLLRLDGNMRGGLGKHLSPESRLSLSKAESNMREIKVDGVIKQ